METQKHKKINFAFRDPRIDMLLWERMLVRIVSGLFYTVLLVAMAVFLITDVVWLRWLGVFLALFFADRLWHRGEADIPLDELPRGGQVNVARYTSPRVLKVVARAYERSSTQQTDISLELIAAMLRRKEVKRAIWRMDVDPKDFREKLEVLLKTHNANYKERERKEIVSQIMARAAFLALRHQHRFIRSEDLLSALYDRGGDGAIRLFDTFSINPDDFRKSLLFALSKNRMPLWRLPRALGGVTLELQRRLRGRVMNRAWTARPTPTLDRFGTDLTYLARRQRVGFLIGHKQEYERLIEILSRSINPNALLVGEEGVGKETVISHLALRISKDDVPRQLFDKRLVSLDITRLVAGAAPEEVQARMAKIVDEINIAGNVVLFIPSIHNLAKTSGEAYVSAADALMQVIKNNAFPVVGTTFPKEYREYIEPRSDFVRFFEEIRVEEITEDEAEEVLVYASILLEQEHRKVVTFGAIKSAVHLAKRYFRERLLPGSAEELLKSAIVLANQRGEEAVNGDLVTEVADERTNVPLREAGAGEAEKLLHLEDSIHERVVNQNDAVKAVADALRSYRSGLSKEGVPIASFLFVGPTGVGKTELAKTLAHIQFGSEDAMVRFDMTEFQAPGSIERFIGSSDGDIPGALTEAMRRKPYSVVLLDEFEKAHPSIPELFLQVLDEGRITDGVGRRIDFEHAIIIATSNAHSDFVHQSLREGQTMDQIEEYLRKRLVEVFKPELLNRFSKVVIFRDLGIKEVKQIAALKLRGVKELVEKRGMRLSFTDTAVTALAKEGYDPEFGARPLARAIESEVKAELAKVLLEQKFQRGDSILVDYADGGFHFQKTD